MVPVKVKNISISKFGFVVFLDSLELNKSLPIVIGAAEAQAIVIKLNDITVPRPITHDLLKNILEVMEARLQRVIISDLKEGTFFAKLIIELGGQTLEVDSRPSDAIALSIRFNAPIFVDDNIMEKAGIAISDNKVEDIFEQTAQQSVDPVDKLQHDLDRAISEERYEDAAKLRDEINKISNTN